MNNNLVTNKGERLSFLQLFSEKKWKIEIPIIQRDYAQGRESSKEIRKTFLSTFYEHLSSDKNIDLDFVYGSLSDEDNSLFIPLDGQQRLTTLFLLHWYLANKDGNIKTFNENLIENKKSKFTYETRTSSSEFCDALVNSKINISDLLLADRSNNDNLSKTIKDSAWYFSSWDNDPTIQSMLTMLDAIHEKFNETEGYFEKLIDNENPIITFQFLNLKEFKLTDDLYIKMNARGKQLTPFENFKAKLEQYIKDLNFDNEVSFKINHENVEKEVSVQEYFSHNIDTEWANIFWNYRDEKSNIFDNQLMNFIRVIATNSYVIEGSEDKLEYLNLLIGKDDGNKKEIEQNPISFHQYMEINCINKNFIISLIKIFDLLVNNEKTIKKYLTDTFYYNEESTFKEVLNNNLNFMERIRFFSFYNYLIFNQTSEGLLEWMRIIYNLTENTRNEVIEYRKGLKTIESLLTNSSSILEYLSDITNPISGFLDIQVYEERIKAILIQKSEEWKKEILNIERHGYFKGQISFILKFSEIDDYYNANKNLNWTLDEDIYYLTLFKNYSAKADSIFDGGGLIKLPDFIWERALLSKGNYLLQKGLNYSFLIDYDRDISWKRLLRDDTKNRLFVKNIFDDEKFNIEDIKLSLNKIIKNSEICDWRKNFVDLPEMIAYLGPKRLIRKVYSGYEIYLLSKEQMNGTYSEYYSYGIYIKYLKDRKFKPFNIIWYYQLSGTQDTPCAVIDNWFYNDSFFAINIYYVDTINSFEETYKLKFFDRNNKPFENKISDILKNNDFEFSDSEGFISFFPENEIEIRLQLLCEAFQDISK